MAESRKRMHVMVWRGGRADGDRLQTDREMGGPPGIRAAMSSFAESSRTFYLIP